MIALTVRQPWAWAIIHAGKNIENRSWATQYRGPLAIHAGLRNDADGERFLASIGLDIHDVGADIDFGYIIGIVDLVDCTHTVDNSRWAQPGMWHWRLANPRAIHPYPARGQQGLFTVTDRLEIVR